MSRSLYSITYNYIQLKYSSSKYFIIISYYQWTESMNLFIFSLDDMENNDAIMKKLLWRSGKTNKNNLIAKR